MVRGECEVWWADRTLARTALLDHLDDHERDRWPRYRVEADRQRFLVAHALARILLGRELGVPPQAVPIQVYCDRCETAEHGKPGVAGESIEFNIAHSGQWSVVAIARDQPVGVDVEDLVRMANAEEVARLALSSDERPPRDDREFKIYWARKEALLKASGDGLVVFPRNITVSAPDEIPRVIAWQGEGTPHLYDLQPDDRHVGCVATLGDPMKISEHNAADLLTP